VVSGFKDLQAIRDHIHNSLLD
jgi:hypothetical protein